MTPARRSTSTRWGLIFNSISTTAAAINFIVTIFKLRAPGMSLNRMPLFCYAFLAVSFALVFALPALTIDCVFLELDRRLGFSFFDPAHGGDVLLWQHLFWIFGHPRGLHHHPAGVRDRDVDHPHVHTAANGRVPDGGAGRDPRRVHRLRVWAHHMFSTGLSNVTIVYFAAASMMVVIPSAIQLFAWLTTLVTGRPIFKTPLLFIIGFIVFFIIGGLSGIMFAAIPFDQQLTDTYFVVAHFHFIIFGAAVFPLLGGLYYWFPKVTGRMYSEPLGQASFWLTFAGSALTFFPMHIVGLLGMPRRVYTYPSGVGWDSYNQLETVGSYILACGLLLIVANLVRSYFSGAPAPRDPFGRRNTRVVDPLAAAAVQLRGDPGGDESLSDVGTRPIERRTSASSSAERWCSTRATRRRRRACSTRTWTRCSRCRPTRRGRSWWR